MKYSKNKYSVYSILILFLGLVWLAGVGCSKESDDNKRLYSEDKVEARRRDEIQVITPQTFVKVAEEQKPAVVNISLTKTIKNHPDIFRSPFKKRGGPLEDFFERFFGTIPRREFKQKSLGSGFIISKEGYILTNAHVIEDVDKINIILSNHKEFEAKLIGIDKKTDIALIKIKSWKDLPTVSLGDSDKLKVGEWVVAIGNPFGLEHTVTAGIVSAKGRVIGAGPYDDFIQTDASINPGNSGGPLFDIYGEVVGINTAIVPQGQGIGFAIPINIAKDILEDLKLKGEVERGWLGVLIQKVTPALADSLGLDEPNGALVAEVMEGSPADVAGLKRGDIITTFNGERIEDYGELSRLAARTDPKTTVKLGVIRQGKPKQFKLKIGLYPKGEIAFNKNKQLDKLGMRVGNISAEMRGYLDDNQAGVVILDIEAGGPAAEAGLQSGDIILEVNRQPIKNTKDYWAKLQQLDDKETILFLLLKNGATRFVAVKPE